MARPRTTRGGTGGGGSRTLSPRAALVLLGLFALLGLLVVGINVLRSSGSGTGSATTVGATSRASIPSVRLDPTSPAAGARSTTAKSGSTTGRVTAPAAASTAGPAPQRTPGRDASLQTKALFVLAVVDATGQPPDGYVGGRQFMNDSRGGTTALPSRSDSGARIVYHEYDVNPKLQGVDRGPQRLVVGDDGSAWMTGDHYVTWKRLR